MSDQTNPVATLTTLLEETGRAHHEAFSATDGVDPDWAIWYANYLAPRVEEEVGIEISRASLVEFLLHTESEHQARSPQTPWPPFYASAFGERFVSEDGERLALYHFDACPFCRRVRKVIDRLGVDVELRDILRNPQYRDELMEARGRTTVPVLRCTGEGKDRWMPESRDIIAYLEKRFG